MRKEIAARVRVNETKGTIHGYDSAITSNIAVRSILARIQFLREGFYASSGS